MAWKTQIRMDQHHFSGSNVNTERHEFQAANTEKRRGSPEPSLLDQHRGSSHHDGVHGHGRLNSAGLDDLVRDPGSRFPSNEHGDRARRTCRPRPMRSAGTGRGRRIRNRTRVLIANPPSRLSTDHNSRTGGPHDRRPMCKIISQSRTWKRHCTIHLFRIIRLLSSPPLRYSHLVPST